MSKILVVDDEEDYIKLISIRIKKLGLEPVIAKDGEQCLEIIRTEMPSLIILDITMPNLGGLEVYDVLQSSEKTRNIPVIFATAQIDKTQDIPLGAGKDHVRVITKPYHPETLAKLMRELLKRG